MGSYFQGLKSKERANRLWRIRGTSPFIHDDVTCVPCGRTDVGVHADQSYCHWIFIWFEPKHIIHR